jgi:hypothetical protein
MNRKAWTVPLLVGLIAAAMLVPGCGGGDSDDSAGAGSAEPAKTQTGSEPTSTGVPVGESAPRPECQSRIDPETGRYLPTDPSCGLGQ